ncbi:MAG: ATP-binding protein [Verrucomicrobiae bacterium]|nr:ATP-binding protein [Verrucomicrobiae bacterium]
MSFTYLTAGLIAGGLQLAVAAYALLLNRRFGPGRVGWSLFCAFAVLATAHGVLSLLPLNEPAGLEILYALVALLLLAGLMHLDALLKQRQRAEAAESARREELTTQVEKQTAYLVRAVDALHAEIEAHQRLESQFVETQKMAILGQLVGGITKDLDSALKKITASAELLLAGTGGGTPASSQHTTDIVLAVERASLLTAQLMAFGPGQAAQTPTLLDLNSVVLGMQSLLRRQAGADVEFTFDPNRDLGRVNAPPAGVAQVLMNLVANAVDAMPDGGRLDISLEATPDDANSKTAGRKFAVLSVSDTGTGMTDAVKARLFEPFFTTKPNGRGLGLVVCWTILKQIGGHIEVSTALGQGTVFKVYFPLADLPPERLETPDQTAALPRGTETILVVEDDPSVRQLATRALEAQGYNVLIAVDGQEGLKVAREHGGRIHLVLADVVMPQMDGRAMADWLKAVFPDIKILFTSGYVAPDPTGNSLFDSGAGFLPKPFNTPTLAHKVREILDQAR